MITGRLLRAEESTDGKQHIKIVVEFSENDKVIVPEWVLTTQYRSFLGLTTEEIMSWLKLMIQTQIEELIRLRSKAPLNQSFIDAIEKMKGEAIIGADKVVIDIEPNLITPVGYKVTLNADGTFTTDRAVIK